MQKDEAFAKFMHEIESIKVHSNSDMIAAGKPPAGATKSSNDAEALHSSSGQIPPIDDKDAKVRPHGDLPLKIEATPDVLDATPFIVLETTTSQPADENTEASETLEEDLRQNELLFNEWKDRFERIKEKSKGKMVDLEDEYDLSSVDES